MPDSNSPFFLMLTESLRAVASEVLGIARALAGVVAETGRMLALDSWYFALTRWSQTPSAVPLAVGFAVLLLIVVIWGFSRPSSARKDFLLRRRRSLPSNPRVDIPAVIESDPVDTRAPADGFLNRIGDSYSHGEDVASKRTHLEDVETRLVELKTLYQSGLITLEDYIAKTREAATTME